WPAYHVIAVRLGPAAVLEAVPRVLAGTAWRLHDAIKVTWLSTTTRLIRSSFPCRMRQDIGLVFLRGSFGDEHLRRGAGPLSALRCPPLSRWGAGDIVMGTGDPPWGGGWGWVGPSKPAIGAPGGSATPAKPRLGFWGAGPSLCPPVCSA